MPKKISKEELARRQEFMDKIVKLCNEYQLSISHEDGHGAFIVTDYEKQYVDWFLAAFQE